MERQSCLCLGALLMLTTLAFGKSAPKSIPWQDTGPFQHVDGSGRHRNSFERLKHQRNQAKVQAASAATSVDVGNVAVIADNGSIIVQPRPAKPIDLTLPTNLNFIPAGTDAFAVVFAPTGLDPVTGNTLPLSDDATIEVPLGFSFPFLGASYNSIFVNSDGNITFGAGDGITAPRDAARLVGGPPRVAGLLIDLDVTAGGTIKADVRADRVVVTWTGVPEFGITNSNTFQITLFTGGTIHIAYQSLGAKTGVIGVAEGGDQGPINEIDLSAQLPGTFSAGAIFEEFLPAILTKQMDVIALAKEFYKTHPDKFDFLVMFTDFVVDLGGAFAFNFPLKNQTQGLGLPIFDNSSLVGSSGELESIVNMNRIGLYWPDAQKMEDPPIKKFRFPGGAGLDGPPGANQFSRRARWFGTLNGDFGFHGSYTLGLNSAMSIMGQETGHRWMAFVPFVHPTKGISFDSLDLLGRDFAHWSFFFNVQVPAGQFPGDPRASSEEGNAIIDFGGTAFGLCTAPGQGLFLTQPNELIDGYTPLDQYLMGLRTAAEVGSFWYADEPRSPFTGNSLESVRSFDAQDDIAFCGKRVNLTVANIQAFPGVGPRIPALGDEDDDGKGNDVKTMAFILLVEQGYPNGAAHAAAIEQVDRFRQTWQRYANGAATGGRGKFDTSLNPAVH